MRGVNCCHAALFLHCPVILRVLLFSRRIRYYFSVFLSPWTVQQMHLLNGTKFFCNPLMGTAFTAILKLFWSGGMTRVLIYKALACSGRTGKIIRNEIYCSASKGTYVCWEIQEEVTISQRVKGEKNMRRLIVGLQNCKQDLRVFESKWQYQAKSRILY